MKAVLRGVAGIDPEVRLSMPLDFYSIFGLSPDSLIRLVASIQK
jgi:hypothetical protein